MPDVASGLFPQTKWSLVVRAQGEDSAPTQKALGELLQLYWMPLYVLARQSGCQAADAEDAVQGFCESLITRGSLRRADPGLGRLRSFLLTSFRNQIQAV
jgi:DNA-directed RNA polymerase specialized sigma24 family protein